MHSGKVNPLFLTVFKIVTRQCYIFIFKYVVTPLNVIGLSPIYIFQFYNTKKLGPRKREECCQNLELVSLKDRELIFNTRRGFSRVNVWLTVSDSSCIFHQILPTAFNSIRLLGVTASKSVLLLHNTAPFVDGEVLSTVQIHLARPSVHLHTLRWAPYLELVPFMDLVFLLTLWTPDRKPCEYLR